MPMHFCACTFACAPFDRVLLAVCFLPVYFCRSCGRCALRAFSLWPAHLCSCTFMFIWQLFACTLSRMHPCTSVQCTTCRCDPFMFTRPLSARTLSCVHRYVYFRPVRHACTLSMTSVPLLMYFCVHTLAHVLCVCGRSFAHVFGRELLLRFCIYRVVYGPALCVCVCALPSVVGHGFESTSTNRVLSFFEATAYIYIFAQTGLQVDRRTQP